MNNHCTRCDKETKTVPVYKPAGMTWFVPDSSNFTTPRDEFVCAECIQDRELAQMLSSVAAFALGTISREGKPKEHVIALETAQSYFMVRNNDDSNGRRAALRAVGLID